MSKPLPKGERLNEFEVLSVLGRGGFAYTYRAKDTNMGRIVTIKEFLPLNVAHRVGEVQVQANNLESDKKVFATELKKFLQEARILASFKKDSGVVQVHQYFELNGTAYIVMEFCDGKSLFDKLNVKDVYDDSDKVLEEQEVKEIVEALIDIVAPVHEKDILHRDIKPKNIMYDDKGRLVLIDFGNARNDFTHKNSTNIAIFSSGYTPPEQYQPKGGNLGPWTDLYAIAAVAYKCLTGKKPPDATVRLTDDNEIEKLGERANASAFLKSIDRGLAVKHSDRPQTLTQWRHGWTQEIPVKQTPFTDNGSGCNVGDGGCNGVSGGSDDGMGDIDKCQAPRLSAEDREFAKKLAYKVTVLGIVASGAIGILINMYGPKYEGDDTQIGPVVGSSVDKYVPPETSDENGQPETRPKLPDYNHIEKEIARIVNKKTEPEEKLDDPSIEDDIASASLTDSPEEGGTKIYSATSDNDIDNALPSQELGQANNNKVSSKEPEIDTNSQHALTKNHNPIVQKKSQEIGFIPEPDRRESAKDDIRANFEKVMIVEGDVTQGEYDYQESAIRDVESREQNYLNNSVSDVGSTSFSQTALVTPTLSIFPLSISESVTEPAREKLDLNKIKFELKQVVLKSKKFSIISDALSQAKLEGQAVHAQYILVANITQFGFTRQYREIANIDSKFRFKDSGEMSIDVEIVDSCSYQSVNSTSVSSQFTKPWSTVVSEKSEGPESDMLNALSKNTVKGLSSWLGKLKLPKT